MPAGRFPVITPEGHGVLTVEHIRRDTELWPGTAGRPKISGDLVIVRSHVDGTDDMCTAFVRYRGGGWQRITGDFAPGQPEAWRTAPGGFTVPGPKLRAWLTSLAGSAQEGPATT